MDEHKLFDFPEKERKRAQVKPMKIVFSMCFVLKSRRLMRLELGIQIKVKKLYGYILQYWSGQN
jgi:hypothetical protein